MILLSHGAKQILHTKTEWEGKRYRGMKEKREKEREREGEREKEREIARSIDR